MYVYIYIYIHYYKYEKKNNKIIRGDANYINTKHMTINRQ